MPPVAQSDVAGSSLTFAGIYNNQLIQCINFLEAEKGLKIGEGEIKRVPIRICKLFGSLMIFGDRYMPIY